MCLIVRICSRQSYHIITLYFDLLTHSVKAGGILCYHHLVDIVVHMIIFLVDCDTINEHIYDSTTDFDYSLVQIHAIVWPAAKNKAELVGSSIKEISTTFSS